MQMESIEKENEKCSKYVAPGIVIGKEINQAIDSLGSKYAKPNKYTGNRKLYDSPQAKINAKSNAYRNGGMAKDPYTGKDLLLKKREAKAEYGNNWQEHLAEADHIEPVQKIHEKYKDAPWLTNDNIKELANSDENIKVISRKLNNAKRNRINEEFYGDNEYLKSKGIDIPRDKKQEAIKDSDKARKSISNDADRKQRLNIREDFHAAGKNGAYNAGAMTAAMSTVDNLVAVIKGERTPEKALKRIILDTGTSSATGYIVSGSVSVIAHTLSNNSSKFIRSLVNSNVPGKVVSAVMATGGTLLKYSNGEIDTKECICKLGKDGVNIGITGASMTIGQALIPIPYIGAAVGAMVGEGIYRNLSESMVRMNMAQEEYERVNAVSEQVIYRMKCEKEAFERITSQLFAERAIARNEGHGKINYASKNDDSDEMRKGLLQIARSFGREPKFYTREEIDLIMRDKRACLRL